MGRERFFGAGHPPLHLLCGDAETLLTLLCGKRSARVLRFPITIRNTSL
jgi:hypothetical protein